MGRIETLKDRLRKQEIKVKKQKTTVDILEKQLKIEEKKREKDMTELFKLLREDWKRHGF